MENDTKIGILHFSVCYKNCISKNHSSSTTEIFLGFEFHQICFENAFSLQWEYSIFMIKRTKLILLWIFSVPYCKMKCKNTNREGTKWNKILNAAYKITVQRKPWWKSLGTKPESINQFQINAKRIQDFKKWR